ncbi:HlyD family efflux transporter periplasmic adaptor subunit [Pseudoalteromonas sp. YIC-656]|uniref:HlyD family secretion protein n=1 Tax=Pseudoalteromonas pernae TaxID=3118054 RepID=UPI0032428279
MNKYVFSIALALTLVGCDDTVEPQSTADKQSAQVITASGEITSQSTAQLAPPSITRMWQYQIKTLAPENTQVQQGDLIVSFEDKPVRDRLLEKQAQWQQAVKELENKEAQENATLEELKLKVAQMQMEFDKAKRKAEIVDHSRSEIDRKKAQIDFTIATSDLKLAKEKLAFHHDNTELNLQLAKAKVARLANDVEQLKNDVEKLKVKAPIAGLVIYHTDNEGEKKAVGESVHFGQPVVQLAVLEQMQVRAQINEPDSGKIKPGQKVEIIIDGSNEIHTTGTVASLGRVFREKSWQDKRRIIDATITLDKIDTQKMRPGMTTRLRIHTQAQEVSE